jgi:LysR family transcriptional regulator, transcriptional activator of the cysJI operon
VHLETLKTFCDLVETGSFSRAARLNFVTQSAVSQQVRGLEARYERRLIERRPRLGAVPTDSGKLLYAEAKRALEILGAAEERLRESDDVVRGTVHVATVYSVGLHTLPVHLKRFLRKHPKVNVRVQYSRTDAVYAACLDRSIDLGIVALPSKRPQLDVRPLEPDRLVLALPPDHALSKKTKKKSPLAWSALDDQPFIAFDRDIPTRRMVDRMLRKNGVSVSYLMELDNIETIKRSVETGLGLSILPEAALTNEVRAKTLVTRQLAGGPYLRPIGVIFPKGRELSAAARAFLSIIEASG